ncbi:major capsid protein [Pseudonocardia zijingensis]
MTLDELRQLREKLQNNADQVPDEEIQGAVAAIREHVAQAREQAPTPELVAQLEELAEVRNVVVGERDTRVQAAAQNADRARDLIDGLDIPEPEQTDTDNVEGTDGGPGVNAVTDTATTEEAPVAEQVLEPALAASGLADAIARGIADGLRAQATAPAPAAQPVGRTGRPGVSPAAVQPGRDVATAKVYLGSHSEQGRPMTSELEVARAVHDKFRGAYQAARPGTRMPVLTVDVEYPEARVLGSSIEANFEKIREVTSPNALVAAGGLCAPLETLYDVEVIGSTARPIRDALARFAVERGGIQFRPGLSAASAVNGAGVWTVADDEAADGSGGAVKDCYIVDCPGVEDATIQAIYSCLEFSNISSRFDPETTAANVREGMIAHARLAERELYSQMAALSKLVQANDQVVGATRHILGEMDKLIAYYRDRHRLDDNVSLTWLAPQWVRDLMRADIAYQMAAGDWIEALAVADSTLSGWFSRRSIAPVWFLDGNPTAQTVNGVAIPSQVYADVAAGGTIPQFPTPFDSLLFTTGAFLFLDGGSLDLGLVRDSELNSRNRYQQFSETFEGVAFRGVEALRPVFDVCPTGSSSGTVEVACS